MDSPKKGDKNPVIINIIRKKKHMDHEVHGAGWKIAYADFMTAMMTFFLVMWLTSSMSQDQKKGVAQYFDPIGAMEGASGVGGALGGKALSADGPFSHMTAAMQLNPPLGAETKTTEGLGAFEEENKPQKDNQDKEFEEALKKEKKAFEVLEKNLYEAMMNDSRLHDMMDFVKFERTPDGLRIDLIENYKRPMFALGQFQIHPDTKPLLDAVASVLKNLRNPVSIEGHTDGTPYPPGASFTNWELSLSRANETRKHLEASVQGLNVVQVVGKADKFLSVPSEPRSSLNRRMSLVIWSQSKNSSSSSQGHGSSQGGSEQNLNQS